jgi:hypothetical protein
MPEVVKIKCPVCKQEVNYLINEEQCFDCWEDDDSEDDEDED